MLAFILFSGIFVLHSVHTLAAPAPADAKKIFSPALEKQLTHTLTQRLSKQHGNAQIAGPQVRGKQSIETVPTWSSSFTYQGQTYPYTMVGTDPAQGPATTSVQTVIIPLDFTLATGETFSGTKAVRDVLQSALYVPTRQKTGFTQYGDEIQRAEFWSDVSANRGMYHVLLGNTRVLPTVKLRVPADKGRVVDASENGLGQPADIDTDWFNEQFFALYNATRLSPRTLPIFLTGNVLVGGGVGGFHLAVPSTDGKQIQTAVYASYAAGTEHDMWAVSHEVAEWFNDPFTNNYVPAWTESDQPQYGCSTLLETGDPLVLVDFEIKGHYFQDEAFLSWFARQSPSRSLNGRYSYLGTLQTYSDPCTSDTKMSNQR